MNTNSNTYTIAYSAALVVIVAFLLAFVSRSLEPKQAENEALDKKKQVLNALNLRDLDDATAQATYSKVVVADEVIDQNGTVTAAGSQGGTKAGFALKSADYKAGRLAVFVCDVDGQRKYVLPVYGMGLWGGISGYVAVNADKQTVYGVYFNHEGETAGLGAEIKDNAQWQAKFQGKRICDTNGAIALGVKKPSDIKDPAAEVDAVTGATLTSNGVDAMLKECLAKYLNFLKDK